MARLSLKLTVLALGGAMAFASNARAASLYDDDDNNGNSSQYGRQSLSSYCYQHPNDEDCDAYRDRQRSYNHSNYNGRCAALVRAVGKRNLITAFACNSARFAWTRETRFVHGDQYANWNYARNASISCDNYGALKSCVAVATPCRP